MRLQNYEDDEMLEIDARNPSRAIVAGIAKAMGGIVDPSSRYSPLHRRIILDERWSVGHHPFGPFSGSNELSQIFIDHIRRNIVVSRVDTAIRMIKESLLKVDAFVQDYYHNPFIEDLRHSNSRDWKNWIDQLFHRTNENPSQSLPPIAVSTIYFLHEEIKRYEKQFDQIADLLYQYK